MARGYLYAVNNEEEGTLTLNVSEEELYNLSGYEFDCISNLSKEESNQLASDLVKRFAAYGAKTGVEKTDDGDFPYVIFTSDVKRNYFTKRLKSLKELVSSLTIDQFIDNDWKIKELVDAPYYDAVYYNGSFRTFDNFIRNVTNETKVIFGSVLYMK